MKLGGHGLKIQGRPVDFQSDGIAHSPDRIYLYYKRIGDKRLFRIKIRMLNNSAFTGQQLAGAVEDLGNIANTGGMIFDSKGNLYFGNPNTYIWYR
ncbi:major royal jelly family protein [Mucilaginibacter flavidus]|uniref:major royal jelly family protein n=1 Tax=Mucilaginibacter flavidus TaxID=2949309 RepID=UPI002092906E|nr:major royal jelly family protein [Mucilaginibacter flavidus]